MGDYQERKTSKPEAGQLQRQRKYYPAKDVSQEPSSTIRSPRLRQRTTSPRMAAITTRHLTKSLSPKQEEMPDTGPLLPEISASSNQGSFPGGNENQEEEIFLSLWRYLIFLGRGILKLLRDMPPRLRLACLLLGLGVWIVLFTISNAVVQILSPVANTVYLITGIVASMLAIHEYLHKRR